MSAPVSPSQPSMAERLRTLAQYLPEQRSAFTEAADRIEALERRVIALEQVISEEMYPENCDDQLNRMLLETAIDSHNRRIRAVARAPTDQSL